MKHTKEISNKIPIKTGDLETIAYCSFSLWE